MRATSLAFITPVWQRFSMTEICLRQRLWVCAQLKEQHDLDATCIVIGDDENLETAKSLGFETVEHPNKMVLWHHNNSEPFVCLGMKFNAGYMKAHELGLDLVFPIGSDSWIDPVYFDTLPEPGELLLSRAYNLVTANVERRGGLWIGWEGGVQWITWTKDWEHRNYKPISDVLSKGCDTSTWLHKAPTIRVGEQFHHQLEYVAFQSPEQQITDYAAIMAKYGNGEVTGTRVFGDLQEHYQASDILAMQRHYNEELTKSTVERLAHMHRELDETELKLQQLTDEGRELKLVAEAA